MQPSNYPYKYICLCGVVIYAKEDNLDIVCTDHYPNHTGFVIKLKTMSMVKKEELLKNGSLKNCWAKFDKEMERIIKRRENDRQTYDK